MLTKVYSAGLMGIEAYPLDVEVDICLKSFPKWHTVGLPESEVKESKERVIAAIKNSGYDFTQRKVTINLAPADVKKEGTGLDLPIALGLLGSSNLLSSENLQSFFFVGELSLNGDLKPIRGILPIAIMARKMGIRSLVVPRANGSEATSVKGLSIYAMDHLSQVVEFLTGRLKINPEAEKEYLVPELKDYTGDFNEICGQYQAKRALEVAASGGHNVLFVGPPGSGKTMLASRLPSILPPLSFEESLETSRIFSVADMLREKGELIIHRPFRSPHHSISDAGLIGGGPYPKPGEVSLAHNGVLFLDELPEFKKNVLELLRQPLEQGKVTLSRAAISLTYPARIMLISACNPCPCGYRGHPKIFCRCQTPQVQRYRQKLSGPLMDRIDLQIEVPPITFDDMVTASTGRESSAEIRARVLTARSIQKERFKKDKIRVNALMSTHQVRKHCALKQEAQNILKGLMDKFQLSGRAFDRILKVSRTVADLEGSSVIETKHLLEAVQYRSLDRNAFC